MGKTEDLALFLREVEGSLVAAHTPDPNDWAALVNRAALASLRDEVRDAWVASRKGLRARFHAGEIVGHTGPAHTVLRAAVALNEAVVHAANQRLAKPFARIDDRARDRLGMWLVPATQGSLIVELVCQPPGQHDSNRPTDGGEGQYAFDGFEDIGSVQPAVVDSVVKVLSATREVEGVVPDTRGLEEALHAIGVQATRQLGRFAARCVEMSASVDIDDRTETGMAVAWTTADAQTLRKTIRDLDLDVEERPYTGVWRTASGKRTVFDLETEEGYVSGTIPIGMYPESKAALDRTVSILVRESMRDGFDDATIKRELISIAVLPEPENLHEV